MSPLERKRSKSNKRFLYACAAVVGLYFVSSIVSFEFVEGEGEGEEGYLNLILFSQGLPRLGYRKCSFSLLPGRKNQIILVYLNYSL